MRLHLNTYDTQREGRQAQYCKTRDLSNLKGDVIVGASCGGSSISEPATCEFHTPHFTENGILNQKNNLKKHPVSSQSVTGKTFSMREVRG